MRSEGSDPPVLATIDRTADHGAAGGPLRTPREYTPRFRRLGEECAGSVATENKARECVRSPGATIAVE